MRLLCRLALLLVSLSLPATADAAEILRRSYEAEPESIDPQKTSGLYEALIQRDLFEGLLRLDGAMKPVPALAESWDVSPDKTIWTFHLRRDASWSNGTPVTAGDFVYSFRRLVDPATAAADTSQLQALISAEDIIAGKERDLTKLGVEAVDRYTLRLRLAYPQIMLPLMLTDTNVVALNRKAIEGNGESWTRQDKIVTNGPFLLNGWTPHAEIRLRKNPRYYDAKDVALDAVRWILTDSPDTGFKRFRAREVDIVRAPRQQMRWIRRNMPDVLHTGDTLGNAGLIFNLASGPFAGHRKLREALTLAVDREVLVGKILPFGQKPAYSLVPPNITGYAPPYYAWKAWPMEKRLARAKALLAEEGYSREHPLRFEIVYSTGEQTRILALAAAAMWRPLGIEATLRNEEWQVYESTLRQRDYAVGMLGIFSTYDDAKQFLDPYLKANTLQNAVGYDNPKFDALMSEAKIATDEGKRNALLEEAEKLLLLDYPTLPLYYQTINMLVSPRVEGWQKMNPYIQSRYLSVTE